MIRLKASFSSMRAILSAIRVETTAFLPRGSPRVKGSGRARARAMVQSDHFLFRRWSLGFRCRHAGSLGAIARAQLLEDFVHMFVDGGHRNLQLRGNFS